MYTANNNSLPEAYIANGRNRMKVYSGKEIFLNNGDTFSLELFNPTQKAIGVKIHINGVNISSSLIVLKPGERSFLERYIDSDNKFVFGTYEVDGSEQTKKAIQNNGSVRIEFFNEKTQILTTNYPYGTYGYSQGFPYSSIICGGTLTTSGGTVTPTSSVNLGNYSSSRGLSGAIGSDGTSCYFSNTDGELLKSKSSKSVETGRVEKGEQSGQTFGSYYGDFESYYFTSIEYKIMPISHRPVEIQSLRKYCGECGTRIKKESFKFCPTCGTKI